MGIYIDNRLIFIPVMFTIICFTFYAISLPWNNAPAVVYQQTDDDLYQEDASREHLLGNASAAFDHPQVCDLKRFNEDTRLTDGHPVIPRQHLAGCTRFIYNRVPKCASRTMNDVFVHRGNQNNFTTIFINREYVLNSREVAAYQKEMHSVTNERFILISHHYLYNFSSVFPDPLTYLNIVREPSSWFQSVFNFHKYTSHGGPWWEREVIGGCVRKNECFERIRRGWGPMKFLCGQNDSCNANSLEVVQRVKGNMDRLYLLVGVIEQLPEFNEVLEYLVPGMFEGLTQSFVEIQEELFNDTKTPRKDPISGDDLLLLRQKMAYENDLYAFAKQRFNMLLKAVRTSQSIQNGFDAS